MDATFKNFYRSSYVASGGYVSSSPIGQTVRPGDFFQIVNGAVVVLGNIFSDGIIGMNNFKIEYGTRLYPAHWIFNSGVTKPYSGWGTAVDPIESFDFYKEILSFKEKGSFYFRGNNPESARITNWNEICHELIIKLTTIHHSFRELYLVTESVIMSDWSLAISGGEEAEIESATQSDLTESIDVFGGSTSKIIQSKDIFFYHRETKRNSWFFRAKKLVVRQEKLNEIRDKLINRAEIKNKIYNTFYGSDSAYSLLPVVSMPSALGMLPLSALNASTALDYFNWADMGLDDFEEYFKDR